MLRFLLIAALIIAVLVVVLFAYAFTRPDAFRIERTVLIDAPPEQIYPLIEDLRAWRLWSPFEQLDPDMARSYGGAEKGVGATYAWKGDRRAGSGRMEIMEADEPFRVVIALHFLAPMKAENVTIITLAPDGDATRVTWAMEGKANLVARVLHLFVDMDKMVGSDFEAGLVKLKSEAQSR